MIQELGKEYFLPLWKDTDWFMGVTVSPYFILFPDFANLVWKAAASIIITCLFASSGIRNSVYDLFLVIHQGFACLILAALW
jgi:hypothetical protein